jgi:hypothetical protein
VEQFIDIASASGSVYRFRPVTQATQLPVTAGNFLILNASASIGEIICCGTALSLLEAATTWRAVLQDHPLGRMFVRLNVFRATRIGEHDDIVARHRPRVVVTELGQAPPQADTPVAAVRALDAR